MKKLSRNQKNYIIMTVVYNELTDFSLGKGEITRGAEELIAQLCECEINQIDPYIMDSVMLTLSNYGLIVSYFSPLLKNWKWNRLPLLTQSILLISYSHFYLVEKVDKRIVINVAVELAKKYIDDEQAKFINAILDGALHD